MLPLKQVKPFPSETDSAAEPTLQQWTDEEEQHLTKIEGLGMPRLGEKIDMWNNYGEKFSGKVVKLGKHLRFFSRPTNSLNNFAPLQNFE